MWPMWAYWVCLASTILCLSRKSYLNIECPPWCSIVGATVTVHQFFCILHFCHTCSLCHVELVVQFPARGLTQVLSCLFPGVLWLWHFLYSVGPHPVSSLHIYTFVVVWAFMPLVCRGPWMSTVVLCCLSHSDSASVLLYFTLIPAPEVASDAISVKSVLFAIFT